MHIFVKFSTAVVRAVCTRSSSAAQQKPNFSLVFATGSARGEFHVDMLVKHLGQNLHPDPSQGSHSVLGWLRHTVRLDLMAGVVSFTLCKRLGQPQSQYGLVGRSFSFA
jgi:hypothetical protein